MDWILHVAVLWACALSIHVRFNSCSGPWKTSPPSADTLFALVLYSDGHPAVHQSCVLLVSHPPCQTHPLSFDSYLKRTHPLHPFPHATNYGPVLSRDETRSRGF